jgi:hypothetical protein
MRLFFWMMINGVNQVVRRFFLGCSTCLIIDRLVSDKGSFMKAKRMSDSLPAKTLIKTNSENDHRRKALRIMGLRLVAVFLIIVFLASECAALLPGE